MEVGTGKLLPEEAAALSKRIAELERAAAGKIRVEQVPAGWPFAPVVSLPSSRRNLPDTLGACHLSVPRSALPAPG